MTRLNKAAIKAHLPRPRFLTLHYAYFIGVCLVTSAIFYGSSTPAGSVRYVDSLFFTVSAMTLAGLNTVNLSTINTFQQVLLFFLIVVGSGIWVSIAVVLVRRRAFENRFSDIVAEQRLRRTKTNRWAFFSRSFERQRTTPPGEERARTDGSLERRASWRLSISRALSGNSLGQMRSRFGGRESDTETPTKPDSSQQDQRPSTDKYEEESADESPSQNDVEADTHITFPDGGWGRRSSMQSRHRSPYDSDDDDGHLLFLRKIGRNSTFHHLTDAERARLGGVEYRAVCLLSIIVPVYFVLWQLLGGLGLGAYLARNKASVTESNGLNPWWTGFFFAVSAFNNSGMSLLDANVGPFENSIYLLITMGLLILAGNTCERDLRETLTFLLDHPRRCYTTLFPSKHTWWLLCSVIVLNGIDWVAFEVLNHDNPAINRIPLGPRILDGLFQALCVRSGGFYLVSISSLELGLQVLYVVMMYISVYPVVITMRNSNVYEERSLGIYADDPAVSLDNQNPSLEDGERLPMRNASGRMYFIRQQLRAQLAHDLWWIVLAVIVICIVEAGSFSRDPVTYSAFNIVFETVSAYSCVGISTGLPDQQYSFCGGWHTVSKLVLCAVMIRGRHRGLPVAIDRAILLPGEHLARAEEEDAHMRMERTMSRHDL
ncbi:hypothetical protein T310_4790 [Rasamsonia emersonii CBS 393.64]|uniref:Potassium transport protein n=1 Tax=Rasamsonia emersonii (strain ATCC 16479 / CBS 393.64 / IMI 116815) TaxID=1408163 RepID=A0A0F4YSI9_RASE3|nr:hypothetical protein T310_4790 [Rasamsonia emersonii CBS 393.64]KKA21189.1 hypothetical protein T310_4790 [Rasamsonia emersonii CBS 393.64]